MIQIQNFSFAYPKRNIVLKNVTATIPDGSLCALIGLNGAGKSTLLGCLTKQLAVSKGKIYINGKDISTYSYKEYAREICFVPQLTSMNQVSCIVRDYLVEGRTPYLAAFTVPGEREYELVEIVAEKIGITGLLGSNFSKLSGGQQQLILLARALVQDSPIVLLDEPMSALDLQNQATILKFMLELTKRGKTVIFSTHNPEHALLTDCNVILLHKGTILCYDTASRCLSEQMVKEVFGDSVVLVCYGERKMLSLNVKD